MPSSRRKKAAVSPIRSSLGTIIGESARRKLQTEASRCLFDGSPPESAERHGGCEPYRVVQVWALSSRALRQSGFPELADFFSLGELKQRVTTQNAATSKNTGVTTVAMYKKLIGERVFSSLRFRAARRDTPPGGIIGADAVGGAHVNNQASLFSAALR
jgi:hypothetical protein